MGNLPFSFFLLGPAGARRAAQTERIELLGGSGVTGEVQPGGWPRKGMTLALNALREKLGAVMLLSRQVFALRHFSFSSCSKFFIRNACDSMGHASAGRRTQQRSSIGPFL